MGTNTIDSKSFKHLNYIKKEPLTGSFQGMRYMLRKKTEKTEDKDESFIECIIWPEPNGYHKTPEEDKIRERFPLDADGVTDALAWLNKMYSERFRS